MNIFEPVQDDDVSDRGPDPTECLCPTPDDQYLMEVDCGSVYFKHVACGRPPGSWADEAFSMQPVAVTLHWTQDTDYWTGEVDAYGDITVNGISQTAPS